MTDNIIRKTFAGCLVLEKIGQGGMGIVYKAHHIKLNKVVCIKILPKELEADTRNIDFFLREAEISKQLDHPNTVHVYDYGKEQDKYYIVMSYVEGKSLEEIIKEKKSLNIEEASDIMIGIMRGLEHAHSKNIIHRDIKPSNIIINKEGVPRIIDFGLARRIVEEKQLTITGEMIGTAYFMSPEQCLGNKIDWRSDLYSAGATYFYTLTGRYPFEGKTAIEVINQHVNSSLPNLYMLKPELPIWAVKMIEKLMKKNPQERYQSATEVLKELEMYKKEGYKNILPEQTEIELDGIKNLDDEKQKQILQSSNITNIQTQKTLSQEEEINTHTEKKTNLQDEKSFIMSSTISHIFTTFLSIILILIYGYISLTSKIISLIPLAIAIFLLIRNMKRNEGLLLNYLISYFIFLSAIYNTSKSINNSIPFLQYITIFIKTFTLSSSTLFLISIFGIISLHSIYKYIENCTIKKITFSIIFFILTLLMSLSIEKILEIKLTSSYKIILIIMTAGLSIIFAKYEKNLYLISFILITTFITNIARIPYINQQTYLIYEKEFKEYQLKVKEIELQVKDEIYLKMSEGEAEWNDIDAKINEELKKRLSQIEIPEKAKIKYNLIKKFNLIFINKVLQIFKNTSLLIAILIMILLNSLYIFISYKTFRQHEI
ncbi:MAG: serine/threonine protein kinase [Elusimicrobiales bacterium]|nr:serine/threonine protein kinase [Elusimicrobiales bacterium]